MIVVDKYKSFGGILFDTPEDALKHEVLTRLIRKRRVLGDLISETTDKKSRAKANIIILEENLRKCNLKFKDPEIQESPEQLGVLEDRIKDRFKLKRFKEELKMYKRELKSLYKELGKTEKLIKKLKK